VLHRHGPSMFSQSLEVHITELPWEDELLTFETAPCGSSAKQWPRLILGSVEKYQFIE